MHLGLWDNFYFFIFIFCPSQMQPQWCTGRPAQFHTVARESESSLMFFSLDINSIYMDLCKRYYTKISQYCI